MELRGGAAAESFVGRVQTEMPRYRTLGLEEGGRHFPESGAQAAPDALCPPWRPSAMPHYEAHTSTRLPGGPDKDASLPASCAGDTQCVLSRQGWGVGGCWGAETSLGRHRLWPGAPRRAVWKLRELSLSTPVRKLLRREAHARHVGVT